MTRIFLGCLLGGVIAVSSASAGEPKLTTYEVQPGDTCWSIAQEVFGDSEKYPLIHRYNELGPLPHVLTPGTVLKLPTAGAASLGKVDWLREEVEARPPSAFDWRDAEQNMPLWRLYRVRTGEASSAGIEFVDQSELRMREQALLVVYGPGAGKSRLKRAVRTSVSLERGGIRGGLARLDQAAMQVKTAGSRIRLASRDSQIQVDEDETTAVSVYDGRASVSAKGATVTVEDGEGTTVKKGERPEKPRPLPKPPRWVGDVDSMVVAVPQGGVGSFQLNWATVKGAARYRVELSRDDAFRRVITDAEIGAGIRSFEARELEPGRYFARVSTIDARRLESRGSSVARVRVLAVASSRLLTPDDNGVLTAVGMLELTLPDDVAGETEMALDDGAFQPGTDAIRVMAAGDHRVRVRARDAGRESVLRIRLLEVGAEIAAPTSCGPKTCPVRLLVRDALGRPAALPGLRLTANPGGDLPLVQEEAGEFSAEVPPQAGDVRLKAAWAGGVLGEETVAFRPPTDRTAAVPVEGKDQKATGFPWPAEPMHLSWSGPADSVSARGAKPFSRIGVHITTAPAPGNHRDVPQYFRTALVGQVALFDGLLGLDAEMAFFDANLDEDLSGESVLDELRLGSRVPLLRTGTVTISPSYRVALPTSYRVDLTDRFTHEIGGLLDWNALDNLYLGTNQMLVIRAGDGDTDAEYAATFDGEVRVMPLIGIALEVGLLVRGQNTDRNDDDIEGASVSGAGALRFYLDRFRIGLQGGGGLNAVARRRLGVYSVGVNIDLGLGER